MNSSSKHVFRAGFSYSSELIEMKRLQKQQQIISQQWKPPHQRDSGYQNHQPWIEHSLFFASHYCLITRFIHHRHCSSLIKLLGFVFGRLSRCRMLFRFRRSADIVVCFYLSRKMFIEYWCECVARYMVAINILPEKRRTYLLDCDWSQFIIRGMFSLARLLCSHSVLYDVIGAIFLLSR